MSDRIDLGNRPGLGLTQPGGDNDLLAKVQGFAGQNKGAALVGDIVNGQIMLFAADKADAKLDGVQKPANAWERQQMAAIALYEAVAASHGSAAADKMMDSLRGHLLKQDTFMSADLVRDAVKLATLAKDGNDLPAYAPGSDPVSLGPPVSSPPPVPYSQPQPPSALNMLSAEQRAALRQADDASQEPAQSMETVPDDVGGDQRPDSKDATGPRDPVEDAGNNALDNARSGRRMNRPRRDAVADRLEAKLEPAPQQVEDDEDGDEDFDVMFADPEREQTPLPPSLEDMDLHHVQMSQAVLHDVADDAQNAIHDRKESQRQAAQNNPPVQPAKSGKPSLQQSQEVDSHAARSPKQLYLSKHPKAKQWLRDFGDLAGLSSKAARRARTAKSRNAALQMKYKQWQAARRVSSPSLPKHNEIMGKRFVRENGASFKTWVEDAWLLNGKTSGEAQRLGRSLSTDDQAKAKQAIAATFRALPARVSNLTPEERHQVATDALRMHFAAAAGIAPDGQSV